MPKKKGVVKETYRKLLENKKAVGLMAIADAGFLLAVLLFKELIERILPGSGLVELLNSASQPATYLMVLIGLYYVFVLLLYSLAKHVVMDRVRGLYEKKVVSLDRFWRFYGLNIFLAGVITLGVVLIGFVIDAARQPFDAFLGPLLIGPYFVFAYVLVSLCHSAFFSRKMSVLGSFARGWRLLGHASRWRSALGVFVLVAGGVWLVFLLLGLALRLLADTNYQLYVSVYGGYQDLAFYVSVLVWYLVLVYNRVLFYRLVKDDNARA